MAHVVVVGPGALGSLFAVRLGAAGHDISLACRTGRTAKHLQEQGVILEDDRGTHQQDVHAVHKPGQLRRPADAVIIATKCSAAAAAMRSWRAPRAATIGLQNGIMGDELALAADTYVPCTVGFPATWDGAGRSILTGRGALHVGPWPGGAWRRYEEDAVDLLQDVAPVIAADNMQGVAWSKLLINSVGMVGTLAGQGLGDLLRQKRARDAFLRILEEGHEAGLAEGIAFEKVAGFHPKLLGGVGKIGGRVAQRALVGIIGRKYRRMKSSSLQSLGRGQKTEAMYLNGKIVATAQMHGIHTPVNDALLHGIREIEAGRAEPSPAMLDRLPL